MGYALNEVAAASEKLLTRLDYISNNISNISTAGFKSEHLYNALMEKQKQEGTSADLGPISIIIDFAQGTIQKTGSSLDVAIEGNGFFAIGQNDGTTTYTRNGSFVINKNKELITKDGLKVQGESGTIIIDGTQVNVDGDGTINVDGNVAGKLKIVAFANPTKLIRGAGGRYTNDGSAEVKNDNTYRILGGYLETSNVNAMKEMVEMIDVNRSFETYQKIIQTMAELDKIATNRLGKLA